MSANKANFKEKIRFRPMLIIWILAINLLLQLFNLSYGWVIFLSNIMLFSLSGDLKYNFYQVEIGGMVGLILGYLALIFIGIATPLITEKVAIMLSLAVIISLIIMLNPKLPLIFNNTTFLYFTASMITPVNFAQDFGLIILIFLFGSVLTNIVALKLLKIFPI